MSQDLNGFKQNFTKSEWRTAKRYHQISVVKSVLKRKAQSPWGFFPLKRSALTKAHFKRTFLSLLLSAKCAFFELFVI